MNETEPTSTDAGVSWKSPHFQIYIFVNSDCQGLCLEFIGQKR